LIDNVPAFDGTQNNYHVQELRLYEDICKPYFTGQLVVETGYNTGDSFISPGLVVQLNFEAPRSDGGKTRVYKEDFRIYSYESKPLTPFTMQYTITLIGQEYYNDKTNVVQQSFPNIPGTEAAKQIHNQYMTAGHGPIRVEPTAMGLLSQTDVPHIVNNKKPIKAIHDILDSVVYAQYKTCAAVYYRDTKGHVIAPLQALIEQAPIAETFKHNFALGADFSAAAAAYSNIHHLKPLSPAGEDRSSTSGSDLEGLFQSSSGYDLKSGDYLSKNLSVDDAITNLFGAAASFQKLAKSFTGGIKSAKYGGKQLMTLLDGRRQPVSVDKNGPGGFNTAEDKFVTALTYSPKYWVSVPMQTGLNVTCGQRIVVIYPLGLANNDKLMIKTLFVPRLVHELRFTEGDKRNTISNQGITDLYCVDWNG
jgi:hypothetical protein